MSYVSTAVTVFSEGVLSATGTCLGVGFSGAVGLTFATPQTQRLAEVVGGLAGGMFIAYTLNASPFGECAKLAMYGAASILAAQEGHEFAQSGLAKKGAESGVLEGSVVGTTIGYITGAVMHPCLGVFLGMFAANTHAFNEAIKSSEA